MRRTGKLYTLTLVSTALCIISSVSVALWDFNTPKLHLWFDLVPTGFGTSSFNNSVLIVSLRRKLGHLTFLTLVRLQAMIANVAREDAATATGILFLFRTTGQVLGVSLSGAIVQAVLTVQLRKRITGPEASEVWLSLSFQPPAHPAYPRAQIIERIKRTTTIIPELPTPLREAAIDSYAVALKVVFICQVACSVLAFLWCLPIEERPLPCVCSPLFFGLTVID